MTALSLLAVAVVGLAATFVLALLADAGAFAYSLLAASAWLLTAAMVPVEPLLVAPAAVVALACSWPVWDMWREVTTLPGGAR